MMTIAHLACFPASRVIDDDDDDDQSVED